VSGAACAAKGEGRGEDGGEPPAGSFPVQQLRPVLGGGDGEDTLDESAGQPFQHARPLHRTERRRRREIQAELDA